MKNKFVILIITLSYSCLSCKQVKNVMFDSPYGTMYTFKYELSKPSVDSTLKFVDDKIEAKFDILSNAIGFDLKNKTNESMKVIWDEVAIVLNGKAEKVTHVGVKYIDKASSQPNSSIPSGASLNDQAIPIKNIYYSEGFYSQYASIPGSWKEVKLFPSYDYNKPETKASILGLKGQVFSIYIPISHQGKIIEYNFEFLIKDVLPIDPKSLPKNNSIFKEH